MSINYYLRIWGSWVLSLIFLEVFKERRFWIGI